MTTDRDSMVIRPRLEETGDRPRRRAREVRRRAKMESEASGLLDRIRKARLAQRLGSAQAVRQSARLRAAGAAGQKVAGRGRVGAGVSRVAGPVGAALLILDAANAIGRTFRRAGDDVSGRLLEAQDRHDVYGILDEQATGAANARGIIEGNTDLLRIVGIEGGVNPQIAYLNSYFRERETARAIGSDLIEREPAFDHLQSVLDKSIDGARWLLKTTADDFVNAVRDYFGKGPLVR